MGAETPVRRTTTAREAAERLGCSPRTVRAMFAEPRDQFEARARERRERILAMRAEGMKLREIAEAVGMTVGGVGATLHVAKKREASAAAAAVDEQQRAS